MYEGSWGHRTQSWLRAKPCWAVQGKNWTKQLAGKRRKEKSTFGESMPCLILLSLIIKCGVASSLVQDNILSFLRDLSPSALFGHLGGWWRTCSVVCFSVLRKSVRYPWRLCP